MCWGSPSFVRCRLTQSSSSICTSIPLGTRAPGARNPAPYEYAGVAAGLHVGHSMCRMKFRTVSPEPHHADRFAAAHQQAVLDGPCIGAVLTFTQPVRSRPLNNSTNWGASADTTAAGARTNPMNNKSAARSA